MRYFWVSPRKCTTASLKKNDVPVEMMVPDVPPDMIGSEFGSEAGDGNEDPGEQPQPEDDGAGLPARLPAQRGRRPVLPPGVIASDSEHEGPEIISDAVPEGGAALQPNGDEDLGAEPVPEPPAPFGEPPGHEPGAGPQQEYRIGNIHIFLESYVDPVPSKSYTRYRIRCVGQGHGFCQRRRNVGPRTTRRHGPEEPVAFLLAWWRAGERFSSRDRHQPYEPTAAEVDAEIPNVLAARGQIL